MTREQQMPVGAVEACASDDQCYLIRCKNKKRSNGKSWSECDYKQYCAKVDEVNGQLATGAGEADRHTRATMTKSEKAKIRREGNGAAGDFRQDWKENVASMSETQKKEAFYDDCAYEEASKGTNVSGFSPDHVLEIQHGGSVLGPLKWLRSHVNSSIGSTLQHVDPAKHNRVVADCCV